MWCELFFLIGLYDHFCVIFLDHDRPIHGLTMGDDSSVFLISAVSCKETRTNEN
jgi:hypothetical protein